MPKHRPQQPPPTLAASPVSTSKQLWIVRLLPMLAIFLLAGIVHSPALRGPYTWDDDEYLVQNRALRQPSTFLTLWKPGNTALYAPLVTTTFWLEYRLWGLGQRDADGILRGPGYHVTNLLLHAFSCILLFLLLQKLKLPGGTFSAWLAAALFAVHPVTVETVAWVAERKNALCFFFLILSATFAFKSFSLLPGITPRPRHYILALLFFLAALLSKIAACFFPATLLILILWRRARVTRVELLKLLPLLALVALLGFVSVHWEHSQGAANGPIYDFSPLQRIVIAGNAFWFQLGKVFYPFPSMPVYPRFPIDAQKPITQLWLFIAPTAFVLLIAALWILRKRIGTAPVAAILLYATALAPTLGFVSFYTMLFTFVADHFQYFALPFMLIFITETLCWTLQKFTAPISPAMPQSKKPLPKSATSGLSSGSLIRLARPLLAAVLLLLLAPIAFANSHLYTDRALIWEFNLQYNPDSWIAIDNYAYAILEDHPNLANFRIMSALIEKSISLYPDDWHAYYAKQMLYELFNMPDKAAAAERDLFLHSTPETLVQRRGFLLAAADDAWAAIPQSDEFRRARESLYAGDLEQSIKLCQAALQKNPADDYALLQLVFCRQSTQADLPSALDAYQKVIQRHPDLPDAWLYLGFALRQAGRDSEALAALEKARQLGGQPVLARHPELLEIKMSP